MKSAKSKRRIVRRNPHRSVGLISFPDLGINDAEWESWLELDAYMLLGCCIDVLAINTQPFSFSYERPDGQLASYTPDACISLPNGRQALLEIKPAVFALEQDEFERLSAIKQRCIREDIDYVVLTDTDIRVNSRIYNARLLRGYTNTSVHVPSTPFETIQALLKLHGALPIRTLVQLSKGVVAEQQIFLLIARHLLSIDWDVPLNLNSSVALPNTIFRKITYEQLLFEAETNRLVGSCALGHRQESQRVMALAKARRRPSVPPFTWGFG